MEQRSQEWFEARKGKITGSSVGAILGLSPYMTRDDVMRRMVREYHNASNEFQGNIATEYGQRYEADAIREFEDYAKFKVKEVGFVSPPLQSWIGASPDGLIGDTGIIEVKCPYSRRNGGEFKSIDDQPYYYAQIQVELYCAQRTYCDFIQWSPYELKIERIVKDDFWIKENLSKLKLFYDEYLIERESPEKYLSDKRAKVDLNIEEYFEIAKQIKELEEEKKLLLEQIVEQCQGKDSDINGHKLTKVTRAGAISYAKAIKDLLPDADLSSYQSAPVEYWVLK